MHGDPREPLEQRLFPGDAVPEQQFRVVDVIYALLFALGLCAALVALATCADDALSCTGPSCDHGPLGLDPTNPGGSGGDEGDRGDEGHRGDDDDRGDEDGGAGDPADEDPGGDDAPIDCSEPTGHVLCWERSEFDRKVAGHCLSTEAVAIYTQYYMISGASLTEYRANNRDGTCAEYCSKRPTAEGC